jgi:peptidyl-prolyl cis-trans isomerase B (cyclophilin B)
VHELGTLSMARGADPASGSDSFSIVLDRSPNLDKQYTAFGRVSAGLDVVKKIASSRVGWGKAGGANRDNKGNS